VSGPTNAGKKRAPTSFFFDSPGVTKMSIDVPVSPVLEPVRGFAERAQPLRGIFMIS
jgi:hypothetical protein